jgi:hypothetical protein
VATALLKSWRLQLRGSGGFSPRFPFTKSDTLYTSQLVSLSIGISFDALLTPNGMPLANLLAWPPSRHVAGGQSYQQQKAYNCCQSRGIAQAAPYAETRAACPAAI